MHRFDFAVFALLLALPLASAAQETNYDESRVPVYDLPDPLVASDASRITSPEAWQDHRRAELLALFEKHVYGRMPPALPLAEVVVVRTDEQALSGRATRREVDLYFRQDRTGPCLRLLVLLPNAGERPVPAFLGYNFGGNHTVLADEAIRLAPIWNRQGELEEPAPESRGASASRWPVETIIDRGYALVTAHYGDIDPDYDDGFKNGVHVLYPEYCEGTDNWPSIGAWAWGLSRALDYLQTVDHIDARRVAVLGHSRLGKTALWAGATDTRFAMVISNNSGCGGAALARRQYGETVEAITRSFPHWFCRNHRQYANNESAMPVDQHQLLALCAPRPLYVASATEDRWADPRGEFLACVAANPVYQLFGEGLPAESWPGTHEPIHGRIGYHLRDGKHDITPYDWEQYLEFADRHLDN